ncbi:hypothetical protein HYV57_04530 [Candidatus Peregrinibacteria bacterium]|nr:hypothetical protein [Candidatus Peregrinibacteria bacterium]
MSLPSLKISAVKKSLFIFIIFALFLVAFSISREIILQTAAEKTSYPFDDDNKSVEALATAYHGWVNDIFNEHFSILRSYFNPEKDAPPSNEVLTSPKEGPCGSNNVSTYCLAEELTHGYLIYEKQLLNRKNQIPSEDDDCASSTKSPTYTDALQYIDDRSSFIDNEIMNSKKALDITLAAYDEFQSAWPMHKKYIEIARVLEKYRNEAYDIRRSVEKYPVKFQNVTTPNCK